MDKTSLSLSESSVITITSRADGSREEERLMVRREGRDGEGEEERGMAGKIGPPSVARV